MTRSRINLTVDEELKIIIVRYFGEIEGDEINTSMMHHLVNLDKPWAYDSIIDMRRYEGTVLATEIEELGMRWALLAQGRDQGQFTAIITDDALIRARLSTTQSLFPHRTLKIFDYFDDGLEWLKTQRGYIQKALAS